MKKVIMEAVPGKIAWFSIHSKVRRKYISVILSTVNPVVKPPGTYLIRIHTMRTAEKYQRKGYMSTILSDIKKSFSGRINYIIAMKDQINEAQRACLVKNGFLLINETYIWRRPSEKVSPSAAPAEQTNTPA